MYKNVCLLVVISTLFVAPCLAADKPPDGAPGLVATLLYSYVPWVLGFAFDTGISKMSVKLLRSLMTATLSMVLGYPTILFAFTSLVVPGGPDSFVAWALASSMLTIGLGAVKIVAYWVINEALPSKKVALLLFVNAIVMVGAAFATIMLTKK